MSEVYGAGEVLNLAEVNLSKAETNHQDHFMRQLKAIPWIMGNHKQRIISIEPHGMIYTRRLNEN